MNELERMKLLSSARKLKEREKTHEPFEDPYSDIMHLNRMSLTNWLDKGFIHFCSLIAYLKKLVWKKIP